MFLRRENKFWIKSICEVNVKPLVGITGRSWRDSYICIYHCGGSSQVSFMFSHQLKQMKSPKI